MPFIKYLAELGITYRITCPYTCHKNGIIERKYKLIVEMGLTLLAQDFTIDVYLINRLPTKGLTVFSSSFHALHNVFPEYKSTKVFRCACFPYLSPYNQNKLQFISFQCVFWGFLNINVRGFFH